MAFIRPIELVQMLHPLVKRMHRHCAGQVPAQGGLVVPLVFRAADDRELRFFSTVATFGTAVDITVAELAIESFFPADAATTAARRAFADQS